MFIGIDTGNTRTFLGLFREDSRIPQETLSVKTDGDTLKENLEGIVADIIAGFSQKEGKLTGAAFSSVVPEVNHIITGFFKDFYSVEILEINRFCNLGISLKYDDPDMLGIDRIVNAEAAYREYGGDIVVVDLGTAVTFCLLNGNVFEGGLIAPGIEISKKALHRETSRLPDVDFGKPKALVAGNTEDAIRGGIYYGWVSMIEGIYKRMRDFYGKEYKLLLTGGNASVISGELKEEFILDEYLTMKGIRYIYEHN